jgi:hypothetical protein
MSCHVGLLGGSPYDFLRSTFSLFYHEFIQLMFDCKRLMMIHWGDISDMQIVRKIEPFEFEPCIESQVQAFKLCGGFYKKKIHSKWPIAKEDHERRAKSMFGFLMEVSHR